MMVLFCARIVTSNDLPPAERASFQKIVSIFLKGRPSLLEWLLQIRRLVSLLNKVRLGLCVMSENEFQLFRYDYIKSKPFQPM